MKPHLAMPAALVLMASLVAAGAAGATEPTRETVQVVSRTTNPCPGGTASTHSSTASPAKSRRS
jgi:hypothetical protein